MSKPTNEQELRALIKLLADPDPRMGQAARQALIERWEAARPVLSDVVDHPDVLLRSRARAVLEEVRLHDLAAQFKALRSQPAETRHEAEPHRTLEEGTCLIARFLYPDLDCRELSRRLDELAAPLPPLPGEGADARERIVLLNEHLFETLSFRGNTEDYYDPDNSCLNRVLDRRTGIPISLSALYILVGRRLGDPIEGVGLPGHFIVSYETGEGAGERILIDPFHRGRILTLPEIRRLLLSNGVEFNPAYIAPISPLSMLARMLNNLVRIYAQRGEEHRASWAARYRDILRASRS